MKKIKNIIPKLKKSAQKEYTLDEIYDNCIFEIENIKYKIETYLETDIKKLAKFFIQSEEDLEFQRKILFTKCCKIKEQNKFQKAFFKYRTFLEKYNDIVLLYNNSIKEKMNEDIGNITDKILEIKRRLLPINNENIDLHIKHHQYNEEYYKQIEDLEKKRKETLMIIAS
jgi:hypothetical protein